MTEAGDVKVDRGPCHSTVADGNTKYSGTSIHILIRKDPIAEKAVTLGYYSYNPYKGSS